MASPNEQHVLFAVGETTVLPQPMGHHIGAGKPSDDALPENAPPRRHRRHSGTLV